MPKAKAKKSVTKKDGIIRVTTTVLKKQKETVKKIDIRPFVTDTANMSIKFGATIPTADYANIRVDVMISVPCYVEEMLSVFEQARDMADDLLDKEVERLTGEM